MQLRKMLAAWLVCASISEAHADTSFAAGSIIIPATATYQTDCGAVSLYGFVYNVLRANLWLAANGFGTIDVFYAIKDTKQSPNRCIPTNTMTGPTASPMWTDGCDFEVVSPSTVLPPVAKIANTTAHNAASDTLSFLTQNTNDATHTSTSSGLATYPNYNATTIAAPATTIVRYGGGAFIINDQDAPVLRRLISGDLIAQDAVTGGNPIDFSAFRTSACTYGTTVGGQVNFHVAQFAFTAPTPKVLSAKPPRLALLGRNANQNPSDGGAFFGSCTVGGANCRGTNSKTGRVADAILQKYLARAGLTFTGAQGCPIGGFLASNTGAGSCGSIACSTLCPSPNKIGQIYDLFDFRDLLGTTSTNKLVGTDVSGNPLYKMFWAPHWEFIGASANADEQQALTNISAFANNQFGVMAECASIAAFEGASGSPSMNSFTQSQFQTCTSSTCAQITQGFDTNTGGAASAGPFTTDSLRNCTDPNLANGSPCAYFAEPGDAFIQIGDYKFNALQGVPSTVADFRPNTGAKYKPGVKPLVSGIASLDNTKLTTAANVRTMSGFKGEFITRNLKDNDNSKSNILYLGIHDETTSVAGTKIALQTLLLLGEPPIIPVTTEVTRSSPIIATINTEVDIVQGTFEKVTPPAVSKNATADADAPNFEFPTVIGHMRAIRANQVSTTGTDFGALTATAVAFDAANSIPASNAAGCGTNFAGSCRTVFTHTAAGVRPPTVFFTTGDATLKTLAAGGLTAANQNIVISRVLAGQPDPVNPGLYLSKLGGVDRSTVAVVGPSLVAGSATRPQMVYFGATDGMLHAVCAQVVASTGCDTIGRELWAFIPRTQIPRLRYNTARIDGSPRVVDLFGDFNPTDAVTTKTFRTILLIPSGSGDPSIANEQPSVTAIDITNPFSPTILWEYATPGSRGVTDFGASIELTTGTVTIGAAQKVLAFVHSNNGGTGLSGSVVTALDIETGLKVWQVGHEYGGLGGDPSPAPRLTASLAVPNGGIPGAALAIDRTGAGGATDVVYATLYGDVWRLNAKDGTNPYTANPLFRFTTDKKPIGAPPSIFSDTPGNPTALFVAFVSGGYFDPAALALWSGNQHHVIAASINTLAANTPLDEGSGALLKFKNDLTPGERGFAQPVTIGDQLFVTSDTSDINSQAFGLTSDTGHLYKMDITNGGNFASVIVNGGAGSVASNGTTMYVGSGTQVEQVGFAANTATTNATSTAGQAKVSRKLWLTTL